MKFVIALVIATVAFAGCTGSVGNGTAYGYVEAIGDEFGTPVAYIKSTLESSKTDVYCVKDDPTVISVLREAAEKGSRVAVDYESTICVVSQETVEGRIVAAKIIS